MRFMITSTIVTALLVSLFLSRDATANQIIEKWINCENPMIGFQTSIRGTLILDPIEIGTIMAEGTLEIQMGPVTPHPNPRYKIFFRGPYEESTSRSHVTLRPKRSHTDPVEIDTLFISFSYTPRHVDSYMNMRDGTTHPLDCSLTRESLF